MKKIIYPTLIIIGMLLVSIGIIFTIGTCLSLFLYCALEGQGLNGGDLWGLSDKFFY